MSLALGRDRWCKVRPQPQVRMWTVYADEPFLRAQMSWFLPDPGRVHAGVHPDVWDGRPLVLEVGIRSFHKLEPIWRQISILSDGAFEPEIAAVRSIELFAQWVKIVLPSFIAANQTDEKKVTVAPIYGRLTNTVVDEHIERTIHLLRARMDEQWTVGSIARAASMSRAHLTRLFVGQTGLPPMRFLAEIRLTEFVRLIEESDMTISQSARVVGWTDPRIASSWFYRRFGITPSKFRLIPHPHCTGDERCARCLAVEATNQQRELVD